MIRLRTFFSLLQIWSMLKGTISILRCPINIKVIIIKGHITTNMTINMLTRMLIMQPKQLKSKIMSK